LISGDTLRRVTGRRVLLISSSGGVLLEVLALRPWWGAHPRRWVAVPGADTSELLAAERVRWSAELGLGRPLALAAAVVRAVADLRADPADVVVSAGTGVAVPYFLAARLLGVPALWVETFNVIGRPGLASRLCGRLARSVLVQHPQLLARHRRAVYVGELY
jgi:UDP-N-acetylglucosamine:LPS N-acetylglucosamine transferase